jgi:hypothetical protein
VITPFGLRHIWLIRQLQGVSAPVDRRSSLIEEPVAPLRAALRGYFFRPTAGIFTYVLRGAAHNPRLCGFVQARALRPSGLWAGHKPGPVLNLEHIAPVLGSLEEAATIWYRLLLHLCIAAGEQQVQRLFARLPEDSPAEDVFRQAGFAVYCRERIFSRSPGDTQGQASHSAGLGQLSARVHPAHAQDSWDVQRLWTRATPRLVLHAEGSNESQANTQLADLPFSSLEHGYVCRSDKGEMRGYLHMMLKPRGAWLRLLLYPRASDSAAEILDHALAVLGNHPPRPIYCAVRDYEGGMQSVLEDRGFVHAEDHSLLVKHTTVRVREPRRQLVPSLEKRAEIAPTASRSKAREM